MSTSLFTPETESYIKHEVKLRTHSEQFTLLEKRMDSMDSKLNWILTIIVSAIVIPASLHMLKLI